jgi:hypothetical protein
MLKKGKILKKLDIRNTKEIKGKDIGNTKERKENRGLVVH